MQAVKSAVFRVVGPAGEVVERYVEVIGQGHKLRAWDINLTVFILLVGSVSN